MESALHRFLQVNTITMEIQKLLYADYLDIVFDRRNKNYGGYELRRNYPQRVKRAMTIVLLSAGIASSLPVIAGLMRPPATKDLASVNRVVELKDIPVEPIPPKPETIEVPPPPSELASRNFTPPTIVENDQVRPDELMPDQDDLDDKIISNHNQDGAATDLDISVPDGLNNNNHSSGTVEAPATPDKPFTVVEQMPEFNGNIGDYLSSTLRYPDQAREAGIDGRVLVHFIVNEDGNISEAKVVRSIGGGCDEEALRVVNSMPRWKPGKQNGRAVKVYFTLPISFRLE